MTLELTPEQEHFRTQVCALLCDEPVRDTVAWARRLPLGEETGLLEVYRRLGERGWLAVNWPEPYGGSGRTIVEKAIVTEELIRHDVPENVHLLGVDIVGLAISQHGTQEQKSRLLPPLARGEAVASVLFSEPATGSDLSRLQTRAEPDGDGWRLHGRKRYSMKAHLADFALCAARTTPSDVSYHGITLFLVPMKNPGVHVEPLFNLSHERFCDVTLDGIRLTRDHVLGEVDDGWQVINQVLPLERTGIDYAAKACRLLEGLMRHAAKTGQLDDPACAQRLLELDAQAQAARLLAWRCVSNLRVGAPDDVQSAIAKWHTTELAKQLAREALELTGLAGVLRAGEDQAPEDGLFEHAYREAPGLTLAGGTSEIMLYFIAASGLGLLS